VPLSSNSSILMETSFVILQIWLIIFNYLQLSFLINKNLNISILFCILYLPSGSLVYTKTLQVYFNNFE
jgi:hypothetical protein